MAVFYFGSFVWQPKDLCKLNIKLDTRGLLDTRDFVVKAHHKYLTGF